MADAPKMETVRAAVNVDGQVHVVDHAGLPTTVAKDQLGEALDAGYQLEPREAVDAREERQKYETPLEQLKAGGEGALRGATLGLGTTAAAELGGEEYRENANRRLRMFPKTAVAGEVAGALAPVLLSDGAGLVGEASRLAPVTLAERGGRLAEHAVGGLLGGFGEEGAGFAARAAREALVRGAAGATEGAAYGLGSSMADSALDGTDWTAERALSGVESGALYGLTGGAALGAAGEATKVAGRKVLDAMIGEGKTFRQAVQDFADGRTFKSVVGNDVHTLRKLTNDGANPERIGQAAEWLRERKIPVGGPIEETRDALSAIRKVEGANMDAVSREMDSFGVRVDGQNVVNKVEARLADLDASGLAGPRALAHSIRRQIAPLSKAVAVGEDVPFSQVWKDSSFIGAKVREASRKASPAATQLSALYDDLRGALRDSVGNAAPDVAAKWNTAERSYAIASTLHEGAKTEAGRQLKNRFISPTDYGTGLSATLASIATGGGAPLSLMAGLATSIGHKFIRERGSAAIGKLADWAARTELGINRVADHLTGAVGEESEIAGELTKRLKEAGEKVAKAGVEGRDIPQRTEERRELGEGALRAAQRIEGAHDREDDRQKRFDAARESVLRAQQNPGVLADHITHLTEHIAHEQPEVASAMGRLVIEDHKWLASKLPKPLTQFGRSLAPPNEKPLVSKREQRKFLSYRDALHSPEEALQKLGRGEVDFDAIDALKERRPQLWSSVQSRVAMRLAEPGVKVPHRRRVFLSLAFDIAGDPSMAPGTLTAIQGSFAPPAPPPGQPQGGASKIKPEAFGKSMATPSQQVSL